MKSIFENINDISTHINNAYFACEEKGAIIPEQKTTKDLAYIISTIKTGGKDTSIQDEVNVIYTENGEYTINPDEGYDAMAKVNVSICSEKEKLYKEALLNIVNYINYNSTDNIILDVVDDNILENEYNINKAGNYKGQIIYKSSFDTFNNSLKDTNLKDLQLSKNYTKIAAHALNGNSIQTVDLTNSSINNIGSYSFENSSLHSINFPINEYKIESNAFNNTNISEITFDNNLNVSTFTYNNIFANSSLSTCTFDVETPYIMPTFVKGVFSNAHELQSINLSGNIFHFEHTHTFELFGENGEMHINLDSLTNLTNNSSINIFANFGQEYLITENSQQDLKIYLHTLPNLDEQTIRCICNSLPNINNYRRENGYQGRAYISFNENVIDNYYLSYIYTLKEDKGWNVVGTDKYDYKLFGECSFPLFDTNEELQEVEPMLYEYMLRPDALNQIELVSNTKPMDNYENEFVYYLEHPADIATFKIKIYTVDDEINEITVDTNEGEFKPGTCNLYNFDFIDGYRLYEQTETSSENGFNIIIDNISNIIKVHYKWYGNQYKPGNIVIKKYIDGTNDEVLYNIKHINIDGIDSNIQDGYIDRTLNNIKGIFNYALWSTDDHTGGLHQLMPLEQYSSIANSHHAQDYTKYYSERYLNTQNTYYLNNVMPQIVEVNWDNTDRYNFFIFKLTYSNNSYINNELEIRFKDFIKNNLFNDPEHYYDLYVEIRDLYQSVYAEIANKMMYKDLGLTFDENDAEYVASILSNVIMPTISIELDDEIVVDSVNMFGPYMQILDNMCDTNHIIKDDEYTYCAYPIQYAGKTGWFGYDSLVSESLHDISSLPMYILFSNYGLDEYGSTVTFVFDNEMFNYVYEHHNIENIRITLSKASGEPIVYELQVFNDENL